MTRRSCLAAFALLSLFLGGNRPADAAPVYELRIYTCEPGKLDALHERFRNHTLRIFEKHGIKNIAYWTPVEGPTAENTLIYILEHPSRESATKAWADFLADPEWKDVAKKSVEANGKILTGPPESVFMAPTDFSPAPSAADPAKTYELRIYPAAEGKLDPLLARFRDHTDRIFQRHGMKSIGYWVPLDEPKSKTHLYYIIEHADRDSAKESWKAFGADPEWQAARAESEQNGKLLSTKPEVTYLKVTDYSPKALKK